MADHPPLKRGVRQSLAGQDSGNPYVADLLARAVGAARPADRVPGSADARSSIAGGLGAAERRAAPQRDDVDHRALAGAADLLLVRSRRPDLTDAQRHELYWAGAALLRQRSGPVATAGAVPSDTILAWIDAVRPAAPSEPDAPTTTPPAEAALLPDADPVRLLLGPEPGAMAGHLAALAERRPDLSDAQRHELYLAARARLRRGDANRAMPPSKASVFAWIDLVVPARDWDRARRPAASARRGGRPAGSGRVIRSPEVFRAAYDKVGAGRAGQPTQQDVAAELGISVRTLQNRLRDWQIRWADLP